jgi:hypothetical protein
MFLVLESPFSVQLLSDKLLKQKNQELSWDH